MAKSVDNSNPEKQLPVNIFIYVDPPVVQAGPFRFRSRAQVTKLNFSQVANLLRPSPPLSFIPEYSGARVLKPAE